jgi:hypothetical protein
VHVEKMEGGTVIGVQNIHPAAAPKRPVPSQRPEKVEHFTGREVELAKLLEALQPGEMVTLCGPGGMGKTALATEAIWKQAPGDGSPERFPGGMLYHQFYRETRSQSPVRT